MVKIIIYCVLVGVLCSLTKAAQIEVHASIERVPSDIRRESISSHGFSAVIVVRIENIGTESTTVVCQNHYVFVLGYSNSKNKVAAIYRIAYERSEDGVKKIPSSCDLRPVELRSGEVTEFEVPVHFDAGADLHNVDFIYEITEEIGRRFGVWFGRLTVPAVIR